MKIDIEPGTYVVAVSGGVDSIALLNLLAQNKSPVTSHQSPVKNTRDKLETSDNVRLIATHFDHGIREDSLKDRQLVQAVAKMYDLPFVFDEGHLGAGASEAKAREARYEFLKSVAQASGAKAIITAHHQDDVLETAIINMLRGTGRRGLASLKDWPELKRPLLSFTKAEIIDYAQRHKLKWREDSTNKDTNYLRNYVRHNIIPQMTAQQKQSLLSHIDKLGVLNREIDSVIDDLVGNQPEIDRGWFIDLDHQVARDVMASWLRSQSIREFDTKQLELLVRAAKIYQPNKRIDVDKAHYLQIGKTNLALIGIER